MASTPVFVGSVICKQARLTAANTARDGSGTLTNVVTGSTNGTRIDRVTFISAQATAAANSAMVFRIFISDTTGANFRLFAEQAVAAVTASNTAVGARAQVVFMGGLFLESGQVLAVTKSVHAGAQDQVDVIVEGGNI